MNDRFTIEEWLTLLEPGIREKAKAHMKIYWTDRSPRAESLSNALGKAFVWDRTPEGRAFWEKLRDKALMETRTPATNRGMIDCTIGE